MFCNFSFEEPVRRVPVIQGLGSCPFEETVRSISALKRLGNCAFEEPVRRLQFGQSLLPLPWNALSKACL